MAWRLRENGHARRSGGCPKLSPKLGEVGVQRTSEERVKERTEELMGVQRTQMGVQRTQRRAKRPAAADAVAVTILEALLLSVGSCSVLESQQRGWGKRLR